jgi:lysophospholipase L1-like esterase
MTLDSVNVICLGDSITHGAEFPEPERWTALLETRLNARWPQRFRVHNRGIGGNTSRQGLARFAADVAPLLPGLLLVQFGLNDANVYDWTDQPRVPLSEYEDNLRRFHAMAAAQQSQCALIVNHRLGPVTGWQGNDRSYNDNFAPYNPAVRKVAAALHTPCIDVPAWMDQLGVATETFVSADGIHLSAAGNRTYGAIVFEGLAATVLPHIGFGEWHRS